MKKNLLIGLLSLVLAVLLFSGFTGQSAARAEWEYKVMPIPQFGTPAELQQAGAEGWELVAVERYASQTTGPPVTAYYLKRRK